MRVGIMAERIKQLRLDLNMTQNELARYAGVYPTTVSKWENQKNIPSGDMIKKLCEIFGCSKDYLIGSTDNEEW